MDSPSGVPESSSPVVLLPPRTQFSYAIARADVPRSTGTRTQVRHNAINHHPRTRSMAAVSASASAVRTNNSFSSGIGTYSEDMVAAGPTTRSRKRSHNSTLERSSETISAAPPVAAAPTRKRKSPSSKRDAPSSKRSRKAPRNISNRKKPPPGAGLKEPPPAAAAGDQEDEKPSPVANCCICMSDVEPNDLASINGCDHQFCFGCIEKWAERENKCPLCKARFTKIERVNKQKKKGMKQSKKVKQRDQRSDLAPSAALEGLLANLSRNSGASLARIVFGGFELGGTARATFSTSRSLSRARFEVEEDSDEDDSPMGAFMRALRGAPVATMSTTVVRPMTVTAHFSTTSTRSYARNVHDSTAGNGAENPLEIDDDSVEEVIEID